MVIFLLMAFPLKKENNSQVKMVKVPTNPFRTPKKQRTERTLSKT